MSLSGSSVRVDRVVAVVATLRDGREQLGSGYLVTGRLVLTAEHCTRNKVTGESAASLRVVRASDRDEAQVADVVRDRRLDVAVLQLADDAPWNTNLPPTAFARVDQSESGVLDDCTGIGFPLFQRDPDRRTRHTSEFHGRVYQTDERESGRLLMREPLIHPGPVTGPEGETLTDRSEHGPSPWGGLSGALMFYRGKAIGVVVEHHPRQGDSALRAVGLERIALVSAEIRQRLGLPAPGSLPCVSEHVAGQSAVEGEIPPEHVPRERAYRQVMAKLVRDSPGVLLRVTSAPPLVELTVRFRGDPHGPPFPAAELAIADGDCWLVGQPGAGKSRLLSEWTLRMCESADPAPGTPIPLLVRAADLLAYASSPSGHPSPPARMLAGAVNAALRGAGQAEVTWLEEFLQSQSRDDPPWLLLVDGLDEIPDAHSRSRVLHRLEETSTMMTWRCRVVVASRPTGEAAGETGGLTGEMRGAREDKLGWPRDQYELLDLSEAQRDELLLGWFAELGEESPERSVQLFTAEVKRKDLDDLARQPLMLVILAQLFVIERTGSLPGTRVEAYDEIVRQVFDAYRRQVAPEAGEAASVSAADASTRHGADTRAADATRALHVRLADPDGLVSQLALARYRGETSDVVVWLAAQTEDLRQQAGLNPRRWALILAELTPRIPLLVARSDGYDFVHATLYEYLAARQLSRDPHASAFWLRWLARNGMDGPGWDLSMLSYHLKSPTYSPPVPLTGWLYAFWSDWPPFQGVLLRMLRRDRLRTCAFVAFLVRRHIPRTPDMA